MTPDYYETGHPHLDGPFEPVVNCATDEDKANKRDRWCANEQYKNEPGAVLRTGLLPRRDPQGVHSLESVIVNGQGPGAELLRGHMHNTALFRVMATALGWAVRQRTEGTCMNRPVARRAFLRGALAIGLFAEARGSAAAAESLRFDELYRGGGPLGLVFGDRTRALVGRRVRITGYQSPPLQPESDFFVLLARPASLCPFCQSDADWPPDIVVVYLSRATSMKPDGTQLTVEGRLEIGSWTDPVSGFVSQLRLREANVV